LRRLFLRAINHKESMMHT